MPTNIQSGNESLEQQLVEAAGDLGSKQDQKTQQDPSKEEKIRIPELLKSEGDIGEEAQKDLNGESMNQLSAKLQTLQEDVERKDNQILESEAKLEALNFRLVVAVAENVENLMRVEELEENIRLLTQDHLDLQEKFLHCPSEQRFGSQNSQNFHTKLVSDIAGLKELMATIESNWEEKKDKPVNALSSEREARKQAKNDLKKMEKKKQEEIQNKISAGWQEENRKIAETGEKAHDLKYLQKESNRKVNQAVVEADALISRLMEDKKALEVLDLENEAQLKEMKEQVIRSEVKWKTKLATLEDWLKRKLASKEKTIQELQRNSKEMEQQFNSKMCQMRKMVRLRLIGIIQLKEQVVTLKKLYHRAALEQVTTTSEKMAAKKMWIKEREEREQKEKKREQKEKKKKRQREERRGEKNVKSHLSSLFRRFCCFSVLADLEILFE